MTEILYNGNIVGIIDIRDWWVVSVGKKGIEIYENEGVIGVIMCTLGQATKAIVRVEWVAGKQLLKTAIKHPKETFANLFVGWQVKKVYNVVHTVTETKEKIACFPFKFWKKKDDAQPQLLSTYEEDLLQEFMNWARK